MGAWGWKFCVWGLGFGVWGLGLSDMPAALETCDFCAAADSGHDDVHADSVEEVLQCLAVFDDDFRAVCI